MINFISSWTGGIVVSVIISTLLEMILPEGKNKKYIKTVIGVYILFSIVSPIISKIKGGSLDTNNLIDIEKMFSKNTVEVASIDTTTSIEKIYITNLKQDIKNNLEEKGYKVNNVSIIADTKDKTYGQIKQIDLDISKTEKQNLIEPINEVSIQVNRTDIKVPDILPDNVVKELKEYLCNIYDVEQNIIKINETRTR